MSSHSSARPFAPGNRGRSAMFCTTSPFGQYGAAAVIAISTVTLFYQLQDPNFSKGVLWVILWFAAASAYFALHGRHRLTLSPEEVLVLQQAGPVLEPA